MDYIETLNDEVKAYFRILSPEFPAWLTEYIETPALRRIGGISMSCGTDYSPYFRFRYWYSNLAHSIGVALIVWHFTHDKKQTLAGLLHDIAVPVFKHCIDFMNGDAQTQESTEARTYALIRNSPELTALLRRDGIRPEEVEEYKRYPIADNATPRLSADRFEYTFSSGLTFFRVWELDAIRRVYDNITVLKNEDGEDELGFCDLAVCEEYIATAAPLWYQWVSDKDRTVMQFLADLCRSMAVAGYLTVDELYTLSEREMIERIRTCPDRYLAERFRLFQAADHVYTSPTPVEDRYCINVTTKTRYVNPLVRTPHGAARIDRLSPTAAAQIAAYLASPKGGRYTGFDFPFQPYAPNEHTKA